MKILPQFKLKTWLFIIFSQLAFIAVIFMQSTKMPDGKFHLTMFDVPLGDSFFIESPSGHSILIDGGINDFPIAQIFEEKTFFDREIDLVILTHPDSDHVNGLLNVIKSFDIGMILLTGVENDYTLYHKFLKVAKSKDIPLIYSNEKTNFQIGEIELEMIYPYKTMLGKYVKSVNNSSIVMRLNVFNKSIMLTGDVEEEGEEDILQSDLALKSDILKVAHHGSTSSSIDGFLDAVDPELALISAGKENYFNHPHPEIVKKLESRDVNLYISKDVGEVEVVIDERGEIQVK